MLLILFYPVYIYPSFWSPICTSRLIYLSMADLQGLCFLWDRTMLGGCIPLLHMDWSKTKVIKENI